jgi:hypothetical protein
MIRLKQILIEQRDISQDVIRQGPADPNAITGAFNAKRIAKQIYDAKGVVFDSEEKVAPAFAAIKNLAQYTQVNKELQKLAGRGIGQYLRSFLDINPRMNIASRLMEFIPEAHWSWTIKQIVPWSDFRIVAQKNPSLYDKWRAGQTGTGEEKSLLKLMDGPYAQAWTWYSNLSGQEQLEMFWKENGHTILSTVQFALLFVPVVGWFAAAGIGLANAGMYYKEGDTKQAGVEAIFALLPGVGKIGSTIGKTIPSIGKLGAKGMAKLGGKLATSKKPILNRIEMQVIKDMSKYKDLIKADLTEYFKARAKNEAALIAKNATKSKAAQLASKALNKLAGGGITLGKIGAETTANTALDNTALSAWDKIYAGAGLDAQAGGKVVLDPDIAAIATDPDAYLKTNQFDDLMK